MGLLRNLLPTRNVFQIFSYIMGIITMVFWSIQFLTNSIGFDTFDRSLFSIVTVVCGLLACFSMYVANNVKKINNPVKFIITGTIFGLIAIALLITVLNGVSMTLSTDYNSYANSGLGFFEGYRQLTSITSEDVNSLENYALGVRQLVRAMFLIVPCLIGTWGGLSVLTADSIDEAEGGILAIVAAFVVVIIVWMFKVIDVSLMVLWG